MRLLTSANMSLAIEPSGPGLPTRRAWPARMLVRRRASASIHSCISRSLATAVRSLASSCQMRTASAMAPEPLAGGPRAAADGGALVHQRGHGHPPALADVADAVGVGHPHLGQVDLVELGLAGHLAQRPHLDARRVHVEGEVGHALVLGRLGVGAGDEHAPVGEVGQRVPHLLPGDDPLVAVAHGPGGQAGQVGAGARAR